MNKLVPTMVYTETQQSITMFPVVGITETLYIDESTGIQYIWSNVANKYEVYTNSKVGDMTRAIGDPTFQQPSYTVNATRGDNTTCCIMIDKVGATSFSTNWTNTAQVVYDSQSSTSSVHVYCLKLDWTQIPTNQISVLSVATVTATSSGAVSTTNIKFNIGTTPTTTPVPTTTVAPTTIPPTFSQTSYTSTYTLDQLFTIQTAIPLNNPNNYSITWSGTQPWMKISSSSNTQCLIIIDAAAADYFGSTNTISEILTATWSGGSTTTNVNINKLDTPTTTPVTLSITPTYVDPGIWTIGQAVDQKYTVTGGVPPYTWSTPSGPLDPGLSVSKTTGEITGIPTGLGQLGLVNNCILTVTDSKGNTATTTINGFIKSAPTTTPVPTTTVAPTTTPVPTTTVAPTTTRAPITTIAPTTTQVPITTRALTPWEPLMGFVAGTQVSIKIITKPTLSIYSTATYPITGDTTLTQYYAYPDDPYSVSWTSTSDLPGNYATIDPIYLPPNPVKYPYTGKGTKLITGGAAIGTVVKYTITLYDGCDRLVSTATTSVTVIKRPSLTLTSSVVNVFSTKKFTINWSTSADAPPASYVTLFDKSGVKTALSGSIGKTAGTPGVYDFIGYLYASNGFLITTGKVSVTVLTIPSIIIFADNHPRAGIVYPGDTCVVDWISKDVIAGLSVTLVVTNPTLIGTFQQQPTTSTRPFPVDSTVPIGTAYTVTANLVDNAGNVVATDYVIVTVTSRPTLDLVGVDMRLQPLMPIDPTIKGSRDYIIYLDMADWNALPYLVQCYYEGVPTDPFGRVLGMYMKLTLTGDTREVDDANSHYNIGAGGNLIMLSPGDDPLTTGQQWTPTNYIPQKTPEGTIITHQTVLYNKKGVVLSTSNIMTITIGIMTGVTLTSDKTVVMINNNESFTLSWNATNAPAGSYVQVETRDGKHTPQYSQHQPTSGSLLLTTSSNTDVDGANFYSVAVHDKYGRQISSSEVVRVDYSHTPIPIQMVAFYNWQHFDYNHSMRILPGQMVAISIAVWGDNIPTGAYMTTDGIPNFRMGLSYPYGAKGYTVDIPASRVWTYTNNGMPTENVRHTWGLIPPNGSENQDIPHTVRLFNHEGEQLAVSTTQWPGYALGQVKYARTDHLQFRCTRFGDTYVSGDTSQYGSYLRREAGWFNPWVDPFDLPPESFDPGYGGRPSRYGQGWYG